MCSSHHRALRNRRQSPKPSSMSQNARSMTTKDRQTKIEYRQPKKSEFPVINTATPTEPYVVITPKWKILNNIVVDVVSYTISNPYRSDLPNCGDYDSARALFHELFEAPNNSVFLYDCTLLQTHSIKTVPRYVVSTDRGPVAFASINSKYGMSTSNVYIMSNNARRHVYLLHDKSFKEAEISTSTAVVTYRIPSRTHRPVHIHPLHTVYHIVDFGATLASYGFDHQYAAYRLEMESILVYCYLHYRRRVSVLQLPNNTADERGYKTLMGFHHGTTIYSYASYLRKIYYYLLNIDNFSPRQRISPEVAAKAKALKRELGNCSNYKHTLHFPLLKKKVVALRSLLWLLLQDSLPLMFSLPLKAAMIHDEKPDVMKDSYCLKVMDAFKFLLKYTFVFNVDGVPDNAIPEEYSKLFISCDVSHFEQLKGIYSGIFRSADFSTSYSVTVDSAGVVWVDGVSFAPEKMQKLYNSFLELYKQQICNLAALGIVIPSVESLYEMAKSRYRYQDAPFYNCFSQERDFLLGVNFSPLDDDEKRVAVFEIIQKLSFALCLMMYFSSGAGFRIYEMTHFTFDNDGTNIGLHEGDPGTYYLHLSSTFSKNEKITPRVMFCNEVVTKFFTHYSLCIYPLKMQAMKDLPLHKKVIDRRLDFAELEIDENGEIDVPKFGRVEDSADLVMRFLFAVPVKAKSVWYSNRLETAFSRKYLGSLDPAENGGINFRVLRQAFAKFNDDVKSGSVLEVSRFMNNSVATSFGHNVLTHLNNYARVPGASVSERTAYFSASFFIMKQLNTLLGFKNGETPEMKLLEPKIVRSSVTFDELENAIAELYDGFTLRPKQEGLLHRISVFNGTFALQAATGFGKTLLFTSLLKAINQKDPGLINVVLVPYAALRADMTNRLLALGFKVGTLASIVSFSTTGNRNCDVYLGVYENLQNSSLKLKKSNLGLLVIDEAHTVVTEQSFRDPLKNGLHRFHLNSFERVLFLSATMSRSMANEVCQSLRLKPVAEYCNVVKSLPHVERVYLDTVVGRDAECPDILNLVLSRFLARTKDSKAVVFCATQDATEKAHRNFSLKSVAQFIHGGMRLQEKVDVTNKFLNDHEQRILFGTHLISNGIDSKLIKLVVFYRYNPEIGTFIQGLGRARGNGVCLFVNTAPCCRTREMRLFYGIDGEGHESCCGESCKEEEAMKLYDLLTVDHPSDDVEQPEDEVSVQDSVNNMLDELDDSWMAQETTVPDVVPEVSRPPIVPPVVPEKRPSALIAPVEKRPAVAGPVSQYLASFSKKKEIELLVSLGKRFDMGGRHITIEQAFQNLREISNRLKGNGRAADFFGRKNFGETYARSWQEVLIHKFVRENPLFIGSMSEIIHLVGSAFAGTWSVLCALFLKALFEDVQLSEFPALAATNPNKLFVETYSHLEKFIRLSFAWMKKSKERSLETGSQSVWLVYVRHNSERVGNRFNFDEGNYPSIRTFVNDPLWYTNLNIPNNVCLCHLADPCPGGRAVNKCVKLLLFEKYLQGTPLPGHEDSQEAVLAPLFKCRLFSAYLLLAVMKYKSFRVRAWAFE